MSPAVLSVCLSVCPFAYLSFYSADHIDDRKRRATTVNHEFRKGYCLSVCDKFAGPPFADSAAVLVHTGEHCDYGLLTFVNQQQGVTALQVIFFLSSVSILANNRRLWSAEFL